jgi:hypothetical protein
MTQTPDITQEEVKRLAGVMPRYFGIWSQTGVHVGVWEDGHIAGRVLADEYPYGKQVEMVSVDDAGKYAAALTARLAECEARIAELEAKLAKAMELKTVKILVTSAYKEGWSDGSKAISLDIGWEESLTRTAIAELEQKP